MEVEESAKISEVVHEEDTSAPATDSTLVDIIVLDDSENEASEEGNEDAAGDDQPKQVGNNEAGTPEGDEPISLSDLSSSFQKCFPSLDQAMSSKVVDKSRKSEGSLEVKPFDYEAARKQVIFGGQKKVESTVDGDGGSKRKERRKGSAAGKDAEPAEHPQGRRRQAFPASGNRSATFR